MSSHSKSVRWLLIAVVALAAGLRFYPIWFGLPYLHARPDEETAVGLALAMQGGDLNPRFFHWPSLAIYLFAGLFAATSAIHGMFSLDPLTVPDFMVTGRGAVALAGTLTVVLIFRLATRLAGATVGLLAALLLSVAILHVRESHFAMTDVLMTLLLTASLSLLLKGIEAESVAPSWSAARTFAAAGMAGGLAASAKYSAAAVLGAFGAALLVRLWRSHRRLAPGAWVPAPAFAAAFSVGFIAGTPYALLDWPRFWTDFQFNFTHLSGGHGLDLGRGWIYHLSRSLPYGAGLPTFVAAAVGVVPFARRHARHAFVLGVFVAGFYLSIGSGSTVFFRYALPLIPIVCLLAAFGVRQAGQWLETWTGLRPLVATGLVAAAVAVPAVVNCAWFDIVLARTDSRVAAAEWLKKRLAPYHSLYDDGTGYTRLDLQRADFQLWSFDPVEGSFGRPDGASPDWVVLHESPLRLYASIPVVLRQLVAARYDLLREVAATRGTAAAAVYDLQDAFFLPLSRFDTVVRPGPTIRIYRLRPASAQPPAQ